MKNNCRKTTCKFYRSFFHNLYGYPMRQQKNILRKHASAHDTCFSFFLTMVPLLRWINAYNKISINTFLITLFFRVLESYLDRPQKFDKSRNNEFGDLNSETLILTCFWNKIDSYFASMVWREKVGGNQPK